MFEFRIMCLECSVISFISPSPGSWPSLANMCRKVAPFIHSFIHADCFLVRDTNIHKEMLDTARNPDPPQIKRGTWRNGLSADLSQCNYLPCGLDTRFVQDFQRNIMFFPLNIGTLFSMLCPLERHFILACFTWLKCKWVPGRTEKAMCAISS